MAQTVPNWLRMCVTRIIFKARGLLLFRILILLSGASYLPQLHRIWVHGNCQGISLSYLLLNLISATEQFTIGFFILVNHKGGTDLFVETPITTGDWLNLAQLTLVWALHLLL